MAHEHDLYDCDLHFKIDPETRAITSESQQKITLVQYDHNAKKFAFDMPRYVEGHDMSLCNKVEVHYLNIESGTKDKIEGKYIVRDMQVSQEDEGFVTFSWLVSQDATQLHGSLCFLIKFMCIKDNIVEYKWNTDTFSYIVVLPGMCNDEAIVECYADVLEEWTNRLAATAIVDLEQTTIAFDDAGVNVVTATFGDGRTVDFTIQNGSKGKDGESFKLLGKYDTYPLLQADLNNGVIDAIPGHSYGVKRADGRYDVYTIDRDLNLVNYGPLNGHTPERGKDYWTEDDKAEIKEYVDGIVPNTISDVSEPLRDKTHKLAEEIGVPVTVSHSELMWTVGKTTDNSGKVYNSSYYALSDFLSVSPSSCVQYVGSEADTNGVAFNFVVNQYDAEKNFISKTVKNSDVLQLGKTTGYVRFAHGRASSSGVPYADVDLESFRVQYSLDGGLTSVVESIEDDVYKVREIDLGEYKTVNEYVNSVGAVSAGDTVRSAIIPCDMRMNKIIVTANDSQPAAVSFLASINHAYIGNGMYNAQLAEGETGNHAIAKGETEKFNIPADTKFIFVTLMSSSNDRTPAKVEIRQDALTTLERLVDLLTYQTDIDVSEYNNGEFTINASNKYVVTTNVRSAVIPLAENVVAIDIVGNYKNRGIYALLTDIDVQGGGTPSFSCHNNGRVQMSLGQNIHIEKPLDAKYLYLYTVGGSGEDFKPHRVSFTVLGGFRCDSKNDADIAAIKKALFNTMSSPITGGGRDVPQNRGVLNAYKRAHQLLDVEWTARSDIPAGEGLKAITPKKHKGLPYSSVKEWCKFVPFFVSLKTFMTAVRNPYSLLYTENVDADNSKSAYGFEYHGVNGVATYYGMVCSLFALTALGFKEYYSTYEFKYLAKKGILEKVYDQTGYGVQLMDLLFYPNHAMLVTDIYRDERGVPTAIHVSESGGDSPSVGTDRGLHSGTTVFTLDGFNEYMTRKKGVIYRYTELYKNLDYEPSPFVSVEDEALLGEYQYNDDICTFAGDYAAFREGEPIYINYTKGEYTSMELYKNDTLFDTIALDSSADVHAVNLTDKDLDYGKYKARLTDSTNHSDYTYFEVIETNVKYEHEGGDFKLTFSSRNSDPTYAQICFRDGTSRGVYVFTDKDLGNGVALFNVFDILKEIYDKEAFEETVYIRVFFKGEYGTVCNDFTATPFDM